MSSTTSIRRAAAPLVLVSHALCPYVQRAAIVLSEKGIPFVRREVDLANKPAWFLDVSPLGKTPVLIVEDARVFESAVICEYLDETLEPRLHPGDALERARHRSWMEFGSSVLNLIAAFYTAPDEPQLNVRAKEIRFRFEQLESELASGPYFSGDAFGMVDAVFGPVFRYFDAFERIGDFGFLTDLPKVTAWRHNLHARQSVREAVGTEYPALLWKFLEARRSALSRRMQVAVVQTVSAGAAGKSTGTCVVPCR